MSNKIRNIFFVVGLAAIVVMCFTFDVSMAELWAVTTAGYWRVAILALWGGLYAMNAVTWRIILGGSGPVTVSYLHLLKLTITGFALNYATPVGLLGGEPYKIMELTPRVGAQRATSSVVLFSMMHIFSHFWYWLTAVVTYIVLCLIGDLRLDVVMSMVLMAMTLFCGAAIYLFARGYKNGMVRKLFVWIAHIPGLRGWAGRFQESHADDLEKIDRQIAELHSQNRQRFYASFFMEYIGRILQSFEIYFVLRLFGAGDGGVLTFVHAFLILAFTSLFANMLFFFPMQLGGREGGFALSTAQMGMTNGIGIFVSLICRVRELFWTAIGVMLMKIK